ncbi:hypothetical protein DVH05_002009 [Phytophthora capsici]|nr:hypothetical protein DVH05_002009 [Phytophthora capsici]
MFGGLSSARLAYILRFIRIMWLIRSNQNGGGNALWAWLQYSRYSHLIRIAAIVVALVFIAHYIACVWTVLLEKGDPFYDYDASWGDQYAASFYSALTLLQGNAVPTSTASQNVFASLSVLVGSIVLAVVFGHVAVLVANFNANTTEYQRKMEEVYAMTRKLQLPPSLRRRTHEYYEHLWHEYECIDGDIVQFSKELSHTLGLEIVLIKYMDLVMTVPFWKDCCADFQKQLMLRLDVRVYLPNDFIMREGEVGDEFYMVNRGYCELVRDLDKFERVTNTIIGRQATRTSFSMGRTNGRARRNSSLNLNVGRINENFNPSPYELDPAQRQYYSSTGRHVENQYGVLVSRGQVFGDLALVMNYQRAANVRAITHVEMCILSRKNFQDVLTRYPDDRRRITIEMLTSYMQSYELSQSHCPLLDMVRSVYSPEAIKKAGGTPPLISSILTTRQAAEKIYTAINVEMNDPTFKFGVGGDIREQLIQLRERRREVRRMNEAAVKRKVDSKPVESTTTMAMTMEEPGDLQMRLQQALERETAILKSLQDLKITLKGSLLRGGQNSEMKLHDSTIQAVPAHQQQRSGDSTAEIPRRTLEPVQTPSLYVPDSNSSPMSGVNIGSSENPRVRLHVRRLARRSQSQRLTEEMVSQHKVKSRASIGSSPTRPGQIYRLRSPTPTDATKSPTYYADALYRAR